MPTIDDLLETDVTGLDGAADLGNPIKTALSIFLRLAGVGQLGAAFTDPGADPDNPFVFLQQLAAAVHVAADPDALVTAIVASSDSLTQSATAGTVANSLAGTLTKWDTAAALQAIANTQLTNIVAQLTAIAGHLSNINTNLGTIATNSGTTASEMGTLNGHMANLVTETAANT